MKDRKAIAFVAQNLVEAFDQANLCISKKLKYDLNIYGKVL